MTSVYVEKSRRQEVNCMVLKILHEIRFADNVYFIFIFNVTHCGFYNDISSPFFLNLLLATFLAALFTCFSIWLLTCLI